MQKKTLEKPGARHNNSRYSKSQGLYEKFTPKEIDFLRKLNTPQKIQDYIESMPPNFEPNGDECRSPLAAIRTNTAHCIEAAMIAAMILRMNGEKPLLVDLTANTKDDDHVIAVFKKNKLWGAIAKSNHYCNGYRDPVYSSIRELVMSYFHEYLNYAGEKTLRSYAGPLDISRFDKQHWIDSEEDVWVIPKALVALKHKRLFSRHQEKQLRPADEFVRRVNNIQRFEYEKNTGHSRPFLPPYGMESEKGDKNM